MNRIQSAQFPAMIWGQRKSAVLACALSLFFNNNSALAQAGKTPAKATPPAAAATSKAKAGDVPAKTPVSKALLDQFETALKHAQFAELEGNSGLAEERYSEAVKLAQSSKDAGLVISATAAKADFYNRQKKPAEELVLRQSALELAEKASGKSSPQYAAELANLASYHAGKGEEGDARTLVEQANAILGSKEEKYPLEYAASHLATARRQVAEGTFGLADDSYIRARELQESKLGKDNPGVLLVLRENAQLLKKIDRKAEADKFEERITLASAMASTSSATTGSSFSTNAKAGATVFNKLIQEAKAAEAAGDKAKALSSWKLAVSEAEKGSDTDPRLAYALLHLADQYRLDKRTDEAVALYKKALEAREKAAATETLGMARNLERLAQTYMQSQKNSEAQALFQKALDIEEKLGADESIRSSSMQQLLSIYLVARNNNKAETLAKQMMAMKDVSSATAALRRRTAIASLGSIYMQSGRMNEGMELLKQISTSVNEQTGADTARAYQAEFTKNEKLFDESEEKSFKL